MLLARGIEHLALAPQKLIWAVGICEHLDDAAVVQVLNWTYTRLDAGGTVALSNVHKSNQDRLFLKNMLDSPLRHRDETEMAHLFAQSYFAGQDITAECDESGANMLVCCIKA